MTVPPGSEVTELWKLGEKTGEGLFEAMNGLPGLKLMKLVIKEDVDFTTTKGLN